MKIKKVNEMYGYEDKDILFYYVEVLKLFLKKVDENIVAIYIEDPETCENLQDFIGMNRKEECEWMTGISIIESADLLVNDAIENANIKIK